MAKFKLFISLVNVHFLLLSQSRESVYNQIGWFTYVGDHKLCKNWSLHTEYQFRRINYITNWQQSLARFGINYAIHPQIIFTFGYGQIETFSYGAQPIAVTEKNGSSQFPEHRLYQDILLKNPIDFLDISHRIRIEERWLGNYYNADNERIVDKWKFVGRLRYRIRIAMPLSGKTIDEKEFYLHCYDEIFIGVGSNVGANVFDQNRINFGMGYKINKNLLVEIGYINQIVEKPKLNNITKVPIFEYNNGFLIALVYNIDFEEIFKKKLVE